MRHWQGGPGLLYFFAARAVLGPSALADPYPGLNDIQTADPYTVTISFLRSIDAHGFYDLIGASRIFNDSPAGASEGEFWQSSYCQCSRG
jgi:hypothetical protein